MRKIGAAALRGTRQGADLRMVLAMVNSSKAKGDRAELDAVRMLLAAAPDLCHDNAKRMLGAGRAEDVGDLYVFPDVAVQVRNYAMAAIGQAVRSSAEDSVAQAANGRVPFGLGLVPFPRARPGSVKWLACVSRWPGALPIEPIPFALVGRALAWVRDDAGPHGYMAYPRESRIAALGGPGTPVLIAPVEAWLVAYRAATGRNLHEVPSPLRPHVDGHTATPEALAQG